MNRLRKSQYFGEVALLTIRAVRMATVKTVTKCKFLALDGGAFTHLLGPIEPILRRNMEAYGKFCEGLFDAAKG